MTLQTILLRCNDTEQLKPGALRVESPAFSAAVEFSVTADKLRTKARGG